MRVTLQHLAIVTAFAYTASYPMFDGLDLPENAANVDIFDAYFDLRDDPKAPDVMPTILELRDMCLISFDEASESWVLNIDHELYYPMTTFIDASEERSYDNAQTLFNLAFPRS